MVRLLLADDEPVIVKGLKKLIPWEAYGIEVIGVAYDGHQAKKILFEEKPDLFISDICMPGPSGIELLKMVSDQKLKTKVIFLSGFQEFGYAQDAIRYGAVEYLLKPVDKNQLESALQKALTLIDDGIASQMMVDKLTDYEQVFHHAKVDKFLNGLVHGLDLSNENEIAPFSNENYDPHAAYSVLNILVDDFKQSPKMGEDERNLVRFSVFNILEEIVDLRMKNMLFYKNEYICMILTHPQFEEAGDLALQMAIDLKEAVLKRINTTLTIGVGITVKGLTAIYQSYNSACEAIQAQYFLGTNQVITFNALQLKKNKVEDLHESQKELVKAILAYDKERVHQEVVKLLDIIKEISLWNRGAAISYCMATLVHVNKELAHMGMDIHTSTETEDAYLESLRQFPDYDSLKVWMMAQYDKIYSMISKKGHNREGIYIQKVKAYIEANYAQNVTLEIVAEIACMNAYYFSTFFKKQTSERFKDYLTRIRMENAVKILLSTDSKVYEIAEKVGFNDYRQFSDSFRKYYGKTPSEYKNSILNEGKNFI